MKITDVLDDLGIKYWEHGQHHHVCEGWLGLDCPSCSPNSGKAKLGCNINSGAMTCWSCGQLNRIDVLVELTGLSRSECRSKLNDVDEYVKAAKKIRGNLIPPLGVRELEPCHRKYLKQRGFDPDTITRLWGVLGTGLLSDKPYRLYIPIIEDGETLSWTTRAIAEKAKLRYMNAKPDQEKVSIKSLLYGIDYVRHCAIVVEGPTDVWNIGPGAVCTFGMTPTKAQLIKLAKIPRRVICFDSSPDAQRRATELCNQLAIFDGETIRVELDAADPGSASKREVNKLRRKMFGTI